MSSFSILTNSAGNITEIDPLTQKILLEMDAPSLAGNQAGVERVQESLEINSEKF